MRQANFPDQKALTARDETNSEPSRWSPAGSVNSGYHAIQLQQPKDKGNTGQETLPLLYHPRTRRYWPPSSLLWSNMWKAVQFIWSCPPPYAKLPCGWPRLSLFSWKPPATDFHEAILTHTLPDRFLTSSPSRWTPAVSIPYRTLQFPLANSQVPLTRQEEPSFPIAGLLWVHEGMFRE